MIAMENIHSVIYLLLSASAASLVSLLELNSHKSESVHSSDSSPALSFACGGGCLASFTALPSPPKAPLRLGLTLLAFGDEEDVSLDILKFKKKTILKYKCYSKQSHAWCHMHDQQLHKSQ